MSKKTKLEHSLRQVLKIVQKDSYATRYDRKRLLLNFTNDLYKLGYKLTNIYGLKTKHIEAAVKYWQEKNLSNGSIKNRMAAIRKLSRLLHKIKLVPTNKELNIGKRTYFSGINRALYAPDFSGISNPYIKGSLELQRVFGLRREESLKIKPYLADKGDKIELLSSWCKGGRSRVIPILREEQRMALEAAKKLVKGFGNSLIPEGKSYISQRAVYDKQVWRSGLRHLHGLRHAYAQKRYKELTGWEAPLNGGPTSKMLSTDERKRDYAARIILTEELGHSREQITVSYLGR